MIAKSGDVSMFLVDWYTRFTSQGGKLMSGSPQKKNFTPRLTSPAAVAALQHMVDCVQYSTKGVNSYDFTVSTDAFSAGKTAMMIMWSTIAGPVYNPATSKVADKVAVAITPASASGTAVARRLGHGHPEERARTRTPPGRVLTYLTSKEWEHLRGRRVPDRPGPELGLLQPGSEQEVPVPEDGRRGESPRRTSSRSRTSPRRSS